MHETPTQTKNRSARRAFVLAFAATAFAAQLPYGEATVGGGSNFDSNLVTWVGSNRVQGNNRKCAGQADSSHNFYGSYACVTSGTAIKTYPSSGTRRARAHNGESFYQNLKGTIWF